MSDELDRAFAWMASGIRIAGEATLGRIFKALGWDVPR